VLFVVTKTSIAIDWATALAKYEACLSSEGKFVDMTDVSVEANLPPCVDTCRNGPGYSIFGNKYCVRAQSLIVESQTAVDMQFTCSNLGDPSYINCEWMNGPLSAFTLDDYIYVLEVLFSHKLRIPPSEVTCLPIQIEPSDSIRYLEELVLIRSDENLSEILSKGTYPQFEEVVISNSSFNVFLACRFDTPRLLLVDLEPGISEIISQLEMVQLGATVYKTKSDGPVIPYSDSQYTLFYKFNGSSWVPSIDSDTTVSPTFSSTLSPEFTTTGQAISTTTLLIADTPETTPISVGTQVSSFPYTGASVQLAEDPEQRNKILIAVFCVLAVLGLGFGAFFLWMRRKSSSASHTDASMVYDSSAQQATGGNSDINQEPVRQRVQERKTRSVSMIGFTTSPNAPRRSRSDSNSGFVNQRPNSPTKVYIPANPSHDEIAKARADLREQFKRRRDSFKNRVRDQEKLISNNDNVKDPTKDEREIMKLLQQTQGQDNSSKSVIYRDLLRKWHPDKHRNEDQQIYTRVFQFIQGQKTWYFKQRVTDT
jgi:hypothetical protein